jgi:gliding motility-associated-like protein
VAKKDDSEVPNSLKEVAGELIKIAKDDPETKEAAKNVAKTVNTVTGTLNGCTDSENISVTVNNPPIVNKIADQVICEGEQINIWAAGGDFYDWTPTGHCANCDTTLVKPINTTNYAVAVSDTNGCVSNDTVSVTVNPNPEGIVQNDTAICAEEAIVLNVSGANNYNWTGTGNNTLSCNNCPSPTASPSDSSTYVVELSNQFGCSIVDSVKVFVNPLPVVNITGKSESCEQETVTLLASGGASYEWIGNTSGLNCTNCDSTSFVVSEDVTYTVEVASQYGCKDQDDISITARPLPSIETIEDTRMCAGDEVALTTVSDGTEFLWNQPKVLTADNILSPVANPEGDIQLVVTAFNQFDCLSRDTVNLEVITKVIANPLRDTSICVGNSVQLDTKIEAESYLGSMVSWSPINFLTSVSELAPLSKPERSVTYTRIIESGACAADTQKIDIKVNALPDVKIEEPARSVNGGTVSLSANSDHFASAYEWSPAEALSCSSCESPEWFVNQDQQEFVLKFTDTEGCVNYDTITLKSAGDCGDNFYIPNTFSPNKDEINDVLYVRGHGVMQLNYFRIFDRWGNQVFQSENINTGWDGYYNGRLMNSAVFVYVMEGVCSNGQVVRKKGNVTLLR